MIPTLMTSVGGINSLLIHTYIVLPASALLLCILRVGADLAFLEASHSDLCGRNNLILILILLLCLGERLFFIVILGLASLAPVVGTPYDLAKVGREKKGGNPYRKEFLSKKCSTKLRESSN